MIKCPSGRGAVPTGYRTADVDLMTPSHPRSFRCSCGEVHSWSVEDAWAEERSAAAALSRTSPPAP